MSVKRKYMEKEEAKDGNYDYTHDCIEHLKTKARQAKHKAEYYKASRAYTSDIHKAFCKLPADTC